MTALKTPPKVKGHPLWGIAPAMAKDPLGTLTQAAKGGDVVLMPFGPLRLNLVTRPELVKRVLLDHYKNYTKNTRPYHTIREAVGNGLVTSEGTFWLRQRRIAQPAFHRQRIGSFAERMVDQADAMLARWAQQGSAAVKLDASAKMTGLTQAVVGATLFGADVAPDAEQAHRAFHSLSEGLIRRMNKVVFLPYWLPTKLHRQMRDAKRALDQVVDRLITLRRSDAGSGNDLLSMLMHARDEETGEGMDDLQLRAEVITMYFAGHETTAATLTWCWYLLSKHPGIESQLHDEVDRVLGGARPTLRHLEGLQLTRRIIDEALRLYPPVWATSRYVVEDDELGGFRIPKGEMVFLSPWVMHRHPALWNEPEKFDPDRFLPQRQESIPKFAYFPFLGGPRQCIGNNFALMEATLVLARVASQYRLRFESETEPIPDPLLTLRVKGGLPMTAERRTTFVQSEKWQPAAAQSAS